MSGKCLLDTNIVIALFANEKSVKDNLAKTDEVFVPSVVIGELFFGAHKRKSGSYWRICGKQYRAGM